MHEVYLVPKDRSKEPFPCFAIEPYGAGGGDSNSERYSGWCGTCDRDAKENGKMDSDGFLYLTICPEPGYCGSSAGRESDIMDEFARVNATHGWGLCTWDCGRGTHSADQLQIVDQTVLPPKDCQILSRLKKQ